MKLNQGELRLVGIFSILLLIASATHLALGAINIQFAKYIDNNTPLSVYKQYLPFSSFCLVTGCLIFVYVIVGNVSLRGGYPSSSFFSKASWNLCWIVVAMSFAVAACAAISFSHLVQIVSSLDIPLSQFPNQFKSLYICSIVDAVIGVVIGLPAGFKMMGFENENRLDEVVVMVPRLTQMSNQNSPNVNPSYQNAPYQNAPYQNAPYQNQQYQNAPYQNAPYQNAPYPNTPYQNVPPNNMAKFNYQ